MTLSSSINLSSPSIPIQKFVHCFPQFILDLTDQGLSRLPDSLFQLTDLQMLHLSLNYLCELPREIGLITSLQQIHLDNNELTHLPREICNLTNLQILSAAHNKLKSVPPEIGNLKLLGGLQLHNNQLKYLPFELTLLKNLWGLSTHGNPLDSGRSIRKYNVPRLMNLCLKYVFEKVEWSKEDRISSDLKMILQDKYKHCSNPNCSSILFGSGRVKKIWKHTIIDLMPGVLVKGVFCSIACCDTC